MRKSSLSKDGLSKLKLSPLTPDNRPKMQLQTNTNIPKTQS